MSKLAPDSIGLTSNKRPKKPIGYWNKLLNTELRFELPIEVQEYLKFLNIKKPLE